MTESRTERLAPWAGVLAAALMAGGFVLVGMDAPGSDASRAEVLSTYGDDAVNSRQAAGILIVALGAVALLGFAAHLRGVLASRVADTSPLPAAAFAGGIVLAGSLAGGTVMSAAVSAGSYFDSYRPDADLAMTLVAGGFYLNGFAAIAGGLLIAATSIALWRTGLLPRWLSGADLTIAVASIPAGLLERRIITRVDVVDGLENAPDALPSAATRHHLAVCPARTVAESSNRAGTAGPRSSRKRGRARLPPIGLLLGC